MNADQYHEILLGLDRVLNSFDRAGLLFSPEDLVLQHELRVIRSKVLKAESGHPFPPVSSGDLTAAQLEAEITPAPWQIGFDPRA